MLNSVGKYGLAALRLWLLWLAALTLFLIGCFAPAPSSPAAGEPQNVPAPTAPAALAPSPPTQPAPARTLTAWKGRLPAAQGANQSFYTLRNARTLEQQKPDVSRAIQSLAWVSDGVIAAERPAAEALIYLAATRETLFTTLINRSWLDTPYIREAASVIVDLEYIATADETAAGQLAAMPFLNHIRPADTLAVESLANLAYFDLSAFRVVMGHPAVSDGISDFESGIVALLHEVNEANPSLVNTLLDSNITAAEERIIALPRAGEVNLTIIRTRPGAARSMDLLENAVRNIEDLIGEPFPAKYVPLLFAAAVHGSFSGSHHGSQMIVRPEYDVADDSHEARLAGRVIAHEAAHYYWQQAQPWLDEGAAEFTAALVEHHRSGYPLEPVNYPCGTAKTIRYLETKDLTRNDAEYHCNYAVGERLFLDLYHQLGAEKFRAGFRSLYRSSARIDPDSAEPAGIAHIRQAFAGGRDTNSASAAPVVARVIDRWYRGAGPEAEPFPDRQPVVAELPTVSGWIERAYLSLTESSPPVRSFAAAEAGRWAWLTLEFSHDYAGLPQDLTFEVVEYYEDGFPYRRDTFTIQADRSHSGGVQRLSVGPGPKQEWAAGQHWIYVYHLGRKVAQVEFEVRP